METNWGYTAMHRGLFPNDRVKPGGGVLQLIEVQMCITNVKIGIISSTDVMEKEELKQLKVCRENSPYQRHANITNHSDTHIY